MNSPIRPAVLGTAPLDNREPTCQARERVGDLGAKAAVDDVARTLSDRECRSPRLTARSASADIPDGIRYTRLVVATRAASLSSAVAHPAAPGESLGIPAWVSTIFVTPSSCSSSTRTSVVLGCPSPIPIAEADTALPFSSDMNSVYTRSWFVTTWRYSPANHIDIRPAGVCTSMQIRRLPPARTSILATGGGGPAGPQHSLRCSGSVHICQMRSAGASKLRSITTSSWER